jgi:hypothetical protein
MRKNYIKYEALSNEVKTAIESFFEKSRKNEPGLTIEHAMDIWFEDQFDGWMVSHYQHGSAESDKTERRRQARIDIKEGEKQGGKHSAERRKGPRRKNFRLDIEVPVQIVETLVESSSDDPEAFNIVGTLVNISKGGFYFKSPKPIEISTIIRVNIDLSDLDNELKSIEALAMVLRSERLHDNTYGVGVIFSSIYEEFKEKLDIFILKNLAYYIYSR